VIEAVERHSIPVTQRLDALTPEAVIDRLGLHCRQRKQVMRARLRLSNQVDAQERTITGKAKGGKAAKNKFVVSEVARAAAQAVTPVLAMHLKELEKSQKPYDKEIEELAESLPVWSSYASGVRGFGPKLLGLIVGETGDFSNYANPAKIWKRMGVGVMPDGTRQRRVKGEEAIAHGYVAERRSLVFMLGDCLIKGNQDEPYRKLYDERKAFELARLPDDAKGVKGWAHLRASRYMQKRVLVDLWKAWHVVTVERGGAMGIAATSADGAPSGVEVR
jgi:hypothetical protein